MTIKQAILQSLEDTKEASTSTEIFKHIVNQNYYDFKAAKTPEATVSALLGDFLRRKDSRVKRIKSSGGYFLYYLSKHEDEITSAISSLVDKMFRVPLKKKEKFKERDLHLLLSTYLESVDIFSKTIYHEKSENSKDSNQKWAHPDMVGVSFMKFQNPSTQSLLRAINKPDAMKIYSYELKREINSDYDLKQAFFQTVSNSSWANYSFLVAFEISSSVKDELERLCQSFGIGVIELKADPFTSEVLHAPTYKKLDYKTIDKLALISKDFEKFIQLTENVLLAGEKYAKATQNELSGFCDAVLNDSEIKEYCESKNIPMDDPSAFDNLS